jgi:hypothetical protein
MRGAVQSVLLADCLQGTADLQGRLASALSSRCEADWLDPPVAQACHCEAPGRPCTAPAPADCRTTRSGSTLSPRSGHRARRYPPRNSACLLPTWKTGYSSQPDSDQQVAGMCDARRRHDHLFEQRLRRSSRTGTGLSDTAAIAHRMFRFRTEILDTLGAVVIQQIIASIALINFLSMRTVRLLDVDARKSDLHRKSAIPDWRQHRWAPASVSQPRIRPGLVAPWPGARYKYPRHQLS